MVRIRLTALTFAVAALASHSAARADFTCSGVVNSIMFNTAGSLLVNYGYGYHPICSPNGNATVQMRTGWGQQSFTSAMCTNLYSMFLTSKATGQKIYFLYGSGGTATSCAQLGNWNWTNPYPFRINMAEVPEP